MQFLLSWSANTDLGLIALPTVIVLDLVPERGTQNERESVFNSLPCCHTLKGNKEKVSLAN